MHCTTGVNAFHKFLFAVWVLASALHGVNCSSFGVLDVMYYSIGSMHAIVSSGHEENAT